MRNAIFTKACTVKSDKHIIIVISFLE
jgi:hypothetical protein